MYGSPEALHKCPKTSYGSRRPLHESTARRDGWPKSPQVVAKAVRKDVEGARGSPILPFWLVPHRYGSRTELHTAQELQVDAC
jgi:hypothetical protein